MALAAPAPGDRAAAPLPVAPSLRVVDIVRREAYRMPVGRQPVSLVTDDAPVPPLPVRNAYRVGPAATLPMAPVLDAGNEIVRSALRDRLARRPGALDARVEWRLTGTGSDLGLGGGLARIVDTLLRD